jgi:WD40 repeat protein/tRNA A-37 threonylcarbamoyl transferase component Bud32
MATNVKPTFLDQLRASGLLEAEQLEELAALPEAKEGDPRPLARQVFQRGWLTKYQINQIVAGRARELVIGPHVLLDRLGEGGMGTVFKARHRHMGRVVALKIIRKEKLANPEAVQRFYREVQTAAHLSHPNIVLAYDAGQDGNTHFLSMEFVDGVDLARLVRESGPLPIAQACEYVRQTCLGLQHAHERGIVHRDIKPHNLLLTHEQAAGKAKGSVVKILDMGLALRGGLDRQRAMTQTGAVIGTPDFLAPEQAVNSRSADIRADLYSLGCTFYFLLSGRAPFEGGSLAHVLIQHQMEEAEPLEKLRADVPPAVAAVVKKLMAKQPEDRFQTPAELAQTLEALAQGKASIQTTPTATRAVAPASSVDPFWNTIVEGDGPAEAAAEDDRTEGGSRAVKAARGKRGAALETTSLTSRVTKRQKIALAAGGVLAVLLLLLGVILLVRRGDTKEGESDRGEQVAKKEPVDKKDPDKKGDDKKGDKKSGGKEPVDPGPGGGRPAVAGGDRVLEVGGRMEALALTPDGRRLAAAVAGGRIETWALPEGRREHSWPGSPGTHLAKMALTPDGRQVVWFDTKTRALHALDTATGVMRKSEKTIPVHVAALAVSPDGRRVLTAGGSGRPREKKLPDTECEVHLWDLEKLRHEGAWAGHTRVVHGVAFSEDGQQAVSSAEDGIRVWKVPDGDEVKHVPTTEGHSGFCSPDGRLVVVRLPGKLQLWDVAEGRSPRQFAPINDTVYDAAFTTNGRFIAGYGRLLRLAPGAQLKPDPEQCVLRVWDVKTGDMLRLLKGHDEIVKQVVCSADGRVVACHAGGGKVHVWDVEVKEAPAVAKDAEKPTRVFRGHERQVLWTRFLSDGRLLSIAADAAGRIWDVAADREDRVLAGLGADARAALLPDEKQLLIVDSFNKHVRMFDLKDGKQAYLYKENTVHVGSLAVAPDGTQFATAGGTGQGEGDDHHVRLWHLKKWEPEKLENTLKGHKQQVSRLAYTPDGKCIVSGAPDGVRVWDRKTGNELRCHTVKGFANLMSISDDCRHVFFAADGGLRLYNTETGEVRGPLRQPAQRVRGGVVVGKGERVLLWGLADGVEPANPAKPNDVPATLWLCDVQSGKVLRRFEGHTTTIFTASVSPDGRLAASGSYDGAICVWNLEGQALPPRP